MVNAFPFGSCPGHRGELKDVAELPPGWTEPPFSQDQQPLHSNVLFWLGKKMGLVSHFRHLLVDPAMQWDPRNPVFRSRLSTQHPVFLNFLHGLLQVVLAVPSPVPDRPPCHLLFLWLAGGEALSTPRNMDFPCFNYCSDTVLKKKCFWNTFLWTSRKHKS